VTVAKLNAQDGEKEQVKKIVDADTLSITIKIINIQNKMFHPILFISSINNSVLISFAVFKLQFKFFILFFSNSKSLK